MFITQSVCRQAPGQDTFDLEVYEGDLDAFIRQSNEVVETAKVWPVTLRVIRRRDVTSFVVSSAIDCYHVLTVYKYSVVHTQHTL